MQFILTQEEYDNLVSKEKYERIYKARDELRRLALGDLIYHCPIYGGTSTYYIFQYPYLHCPIHNHQNVELSNLMCKSSNRILPK